MLWSELHRHQEPQSKEAENLPIFHPLPFNDFVVVSRCVECDLAEPESLASPGGSAPGVVDGILSLLSCPYNFQDDRLVSLGVMVIDEVLIPEMVV